MVERLPARSITSSASSRMLISRSLPTLATTVLRPARSASASSATTVSRASQNERVCWPPPNTVIGSLRTAAATKRGTTMP
jgi:hypothetical protein